MTTTLRPPCRPWSAEVEKQSDEPFLVQVFIAAAKFATDIWDSRPRVRAGQDPFDFVPFYQRQMAASSYHLSVALGRPAVKELEWYQALERSEMTPSTRKALGKLYQAIDWAKEQTLEQQRLGGSLRTAFIFLQEAMWEIYHSLSSSNQSKLIDLLAAIQERWGWKETYEDGDAKGSLPSVQQRPIAPCAQVKTIVKQPSKNALTAYRVWLVTGKTQNELAEMLTKELRRFVCQGTVSRWIDQAQRWLEAGNVLPDLSPSPNKKPLPMDPERIDLGQRQDHRSERQRERRNSDPDN